MEYNELIQEVNNNTQLVALCSQSSVRASYSKNLNPDTKTVNVTVTDREQDDAILSVEQLVGSLNDAKSLNKVSIRQILNESKEYYLTFVY